jgi:hypothetical protein
MLGIGAKAGIVLRGCPLGVVFGAEMEDLGVLVEEVGCGGMACDLLAFEFDLAIAIAV